MQTQRAIARTTTPTSGLQIDQDRRFQTERARVRLAYSKSNHVPRADLAHHVDVATELKLAEWQKDLRMYGVTSLVATVLLTYLPIALLPGIFGVMDAAAVSLTGCVALYAAGRWFALLSGTIGGFFAAIFSGIIPPVITVVHVAIHDGAPDFFRWRNIAAAWIVVAGGIFAMQF